MLARAVARKKRGDASAHRYNEDKDDGEEDDGEKVVDDVDGDEGNDGKKKSRSVCSVRLGNTDLGKIVNGFPGDPIELRPFDFIFQKQTILNTWRAVGFIPMTANAVNDPKVWYELGDGGAPQAAQERLEALVQEYNASGDKLAAMGFNAELLDLEPTRVVDDTIPENEEARIDAIVKSGAINKAGTLFRCGISVANSREVLTAFKRIKANDVQAKEAKDHKAKDQQDFIQWMGLKEFAMSYADDQKVDARVIQYLRRRQLWLL